MSIYLGQLGRMVELKCPATQQVSMTDGYSFEETLEGKVKAQAKPFQRRTWSLGTSDATTPAEQATLMSLINGEWGNGPFMFVSADAPVTNLLTPAVAACLEVVSGAGLSAGGPVDLGGGIWAGRSWMVSSPSVPINFNATQVPILPGVPVTGSAWIRGAGSAVRLYWYDAAGAYMQVTPATATGLPLEFKRASVTAVPPAGAASCRVGVTNGVAATRPAVTWTASAFEWAAGEGCTKAVIHAASKSLVMASRDPLGGRYSSLSYTITEVG